MKTVLHITAAGTQWWHKSGKAWSLASGPGKGPVWVMTDLSEESVAEIAVPRVFGADRRRFVERQLIARYPETEFRAALTPKSGGGLLDRLAPPVQTLTAVEPGDRIRAALQHIQAPVAGVWSATMLLTRLGQRGNLPANLFIVHCQSGALRILYLKDRAPALTRLVTVSANPAEQAAEVVRTLRHLENTRVIDRGSQRFAVLLLGGNAELANALVRERLDCLPPLAAWAALPDPQSNSVLFDMVCKSPPGQLAPLFYRSGYLARDLSLAARMLAGLSLLAALWMGYASVQASMQAKRDLSQVEAALADLGAQIGQVDQSIASFGVSPDMVRNALAIDEREISSAPSLQADLKRLSTVISAAPYVRIKELKWQVMEPSAKACGDATAVPADPANPDNPDGSVADAEAASVRVVELQFGLQVPPEMGPRQVMAQAENISRALAAMKGATVLKDPARTLREGDIRIGEAAADNVALQWCVSLAAPVGKGPGAVLVGGAP